MKVKDAMHKGVDWVSPDTPVTELPPSASCRDRGVAKLTPYLRASRPPPRTGNH
jgi:hypothetical protein